MKFLLLILLGLQAQAFEIPGLELVYTYPVETSLVNPDLRNTADVWIEMINGAKKTIDFEEQYVSSKPGELLEPVIAALEKAANRGVKIRFLIEERMLRASYTDTIQRLAKIRGLQVRTLNFGKLGTDGIIHAKYFVVDGREAFLGSANFDWRSLKHVRETGLKITDRGIAKQLAEIFQFDWKAWERLERKQKVALARGGAKIPATAAYLVASPKALLPPGIPDSEAELVRLLGVAKREVRIELMDYAPLQNDHVTYYPTIDNALRAAAARGVRVKLLVSHWNQTSPEIHYLQSLSLVPNVIVKIATIPMAAEGKIPFGRVNHAKFMTIDGEIAWLGTSNWSGGYLDKVRNVEVVMYNEAMAKRLAAFHDQLWESPYGATIDPLKNYPAPNKGE